MEYIYIIENNKTGKFYIGRTNDPSARKRCHLSELRRGVHGNPRLQASFNKHGEDVFEFKVVDSATPEMITAKEAEWFSAFDENKDYLYNCHFETYGGPKIFKPLSKETASKISESIKNGTRKFIFEILDERYDGASIRFLAKKYNVGANTLLDYTPEWEKLRNLTMPKSVQSKQTREKVELFVAAFEFYGHDALRNLNKFKITRSSLKKYLPEFGMTFQQVLIRT